MKIENYNYVWYSQTTKTKMKMVDFASSFSLLKLKASSYNYY